MRMLAHPPASERRDGSLSRYDWTKAARGKYAGRTRAEPRSRHDGKRSSPTRQSAVPRSTSATRSYSTSAEVHEAREMEAMAQTTRAQQRFHKSLAVYETAKDLLAETAGFHEEGSRIGRSRDVWRGKVDQFDVDTARIARERQERVGCSTRGTAAGVRASGH